MDLTASDLTAIIKEALARYKTREFGKAEYVQKPNGFIVQFYDGPLQQEQVATEEDDDYPKLEPTPVIQMPSFDFGSGGLGGFGGFGGGESGGGGASVDW